MSGNATNQALADLRYILSTILGKQLVAGSLAFLDWRDSTHPVSFLDDLQSHLSKQVLKSWFTSNRIERWLDSDLGHRERPLSISIFEGVQSFGLLAEVGVQNRRAER